jgi:hypothetical protein
MFGKQVRRQFPCSAGLVPLAVLVFIGPPEWQLVCFFWYIYIYSLLILLTRYYCNVYGMRTTSATTNGPHYTSSTLLPWLTWMGLVTRGNTSSRYICFLLLYGISDKMTVNVSRGPSKCLPFPSLLISLISPKSIIFRLHALSLPS